MINRAKRIAKSTLRPAYRAYRKFVPGTWALSNLTNKFFISRAVDKALKTKDLESALGSLQLFVEDLWNERYSASVLKRLINTDEYRAQIKRYHQDQAQLKKAKSSLKIAVYTAISGGYDSLKLPEVLDPH